MDLAQFSYEISAYVWLLLLTAAILLTAVWVAWRRRDRPGALPLSLMLVAVALWVSGSGLEFAPREIPKSR